jgi:S1-C subfamily serine protease
MGEVVGVVSQVLAEAAGYHGVGFAIPSNLARQILLEERTLWTGITGRMVEGASARLLGLPQNRGILIERLAGESPAARIGLKGGTRRGRLGKEEMTLGGDVLLAVNDISFDSEDGRGRIRQLLKRLPVGSRVHVKFLRDRKVQEIETRIEP